MWSRISFFLGCHNQFYSRLTSAIFRLSGNHRLSKPYHPLIRAIPTLALVWPFHLLKSSTHEDPDPQTKLNNIMKSALIQIVQGNYADADKQFHELLNLIRDLNKQHHFTDLQSLGQQTRVYAEMANLALVTHRYDEAEKLIKEAIQTGVKAGLAPTSLPLMELSLKLALVYEQLNQIDLSESGFLFCINEQKRKLESTNDPDENYLRDEEAMLGMCSDKYAKFLFAINRPQQAHTYTQQALSIAQRLYPPDHPNCITLLIDMGVLLADMNNFDQSRSYLNQAIKLGQANFKIIPTQLHSHTEQYEAYLLANCLTHALLQLASLEAMTGNKDMAKQLIDQVHGVHNRMHQWGLTAIGQDLDQLNQIKVKYRL